MTTENAQTTEGFWEDLYGRDERIWSGNPNPVLVSEVSSLAPGTALDLGCGEGADALWLARLGWRVTAVDVSPTALARGEEHAASTGLAERVRWLRSDLSLTFPAGKFDLVTAQFLHSPIGFPRDDVLRSAAAAVAPGGRLLIVGHAEVPPWAHTHDPAAPRLDVPAPELPTPEQVLERLDLDPAIWTVETAELRDRTVADHDGNPASIADSVLSVTRDR